MANPDPNGNDIFSLDNWLPMEPKPDDFISPPIIVWNYPTKEERQKASRRECSKRYHENNKEEFAKYQKEWYTKNKEKVLKRQRKYNENNKEKKAKRQTDWYENNKEKRRDWRRKYHENIKKIIIDYYSNGLQECACCRTKSNLTLDHINGDGKQHRKELGRSGLVFYLWLIRNNFPEGFQVLCFECNLSKGTRKYCHMHQKDLRQDPSTTAIIPNLGRLN